MTTSLFGQRPYEWVSYPLQWDIHILRDWLSHYAIRIKSSPELAETMRAKTGEFEMVPIPRVLMERITEGHMGSIGSASDPGDIAALDTRQTQPVPMFSTPLTQSAEGLLKLRKYPVLVKTFRTFIKALEDGDEDTLKKVIADDYIDDSGRDRQALLSDIGRLIEKAGRLRFIPVNAEELQVVGNTFVANVTGAWEMGEDDEIKSSAFFRIEVIFAGDDRGNTLIASIATK